VVARSFFAAHFPVDAGSRETRRKLRAEQQMIEP
jgi:hypothetical protein